MSVIATQDVTKTVLNSDGTFLDKLIGGLKAPITAADAVEKSIVLYSVVTYTLLGIAGGVAMESRGVNVPLVSNWLRPKSRRV